MVDSSSFPIHLNVTKMNMAGSKTTLSFEEEFLPAIRRALGQFDDDADGKITNGKYVFVTSTKDEKAGFDKAAEKAGLPSARDLGVVHHGTSERTQDFEIDDYAKALYDWLNKGTWNMSSGWLARPYYIDDQTTEIPLYKLQTYVSLQKPSWLSMF